MPQHVGRYRSYEIQLKWYHLDRLVGSPANRQAEPINTVTISVGTGRLDRHASG